jgi:riboflavin kinase/FMN adenylyltransferase
MSKGALDLSIPPGIPRDGRGTVVTVGSFDGVHLGHQAVLEEIRARADATDARAVLLTFEPHPLRILRPHLAPAILTTAREKTEILAQSGLDFVVFLRFSRALADYTPRRFVEEILLGRLGVTELVIGHNHAFGRNRSGDAATLQEIGVELGFAVNLVEPVRTGDSPISSTRIREAVAGGAVEDARIGLGRPYSFLGKVVRGEGRGRGLGFPTANLLVDAPDKLLPPSGIYAVWANLPTGVFPGALHIGPRPTFPGSPPSVELYLIDFTGDLYGEELRVDLIRRLRGVEAFGSAEALVEQMEQDVAEATAVLDADRVSSSSLH